MCAGDGAMQLIRRFVRRFEIVLAGGGHDTSVLPPAPYNPKTSGHFSLTQGHCWNEPRHVLCTVEAILGRKWTNQGNALKDIQALGVYLALDTNDEEYFQDFPPSNIILHPNYNSSGTVIPDDDSVKREVAIVQLPSDAKNTPLPIQCTPGVAGIGTEVTVFDWVDGEFAGQKILVRAQYLRVQCPPALFSQDSTNCFQLSNRSAFDVNDMGNLGSPVVLNYGQANATAVAIKAYTFNVTATETMMAAASFSDPEVWSFVCQYAEKCIGNFTTTTSVPSTSTPLIPTTTPGNIKNTTSQKVMKTPPGPDSQPPPPPGKWAKFMQFLRGLFA
ncbi:unnamed protein product [Notodromas monacha]|uniref:Uncharacterized protein n=1 Tax=Notodromas monacha TaxID=399045 RepID=A0A7R9C0M5_9CRUS|nr:unnamed protein product [Notodromas monacha]CAG0924125.1 unnamed protein product [Notodromas monacha]